MLQMQQQMLWEEPLGAASTLGQDQLAEVDAGRQETEHRNFGRLQGSIQGQGGSLGGTCSVAQRGGSGAEHCLQEGCILPGWGGPAGQAAYSLC